jgi:hypothetical protein
MNSEIFSDQSITKSKISMCLTLGSWNLDFVSLAKL